MEQLESTDKNNANNYELREEVEQDGTTGEEVKVDVETDAVKNKYAGFTYDGDNPNNIVIGNIAGDGSLVLKVYYTRNSYILTLQKDENIESVTGKGINKNEGISVDEITGEATFKYEQPIEIDANLKTVQGYTVTFKAWETTSTQVLNTEEEKAKQKTTFTMPAEDVTAKATSNIEANTVEYTIEYYYEGEDGYLETPTYTNEMPRTAKVGETVTVTEADKTPDTRKPGYTFDENGANVLTETIPVAGTVTLKVYFKKATYTLNIVAGDGITGIQLGEETAGANGTLIGTYGYGESITIDASYVEEEGYTKEFGKWKSNSQTLMADNTTKNLEFTMPAGDLTLTAVANRTALDTSYRVEFYYQKDGEYPEVPDDTVVRAKDVVTEENIKTGQQVSITSADRAPIKDGYTYDDNAEGKVEGTGEGGVAADGSTTLRVYYKQQFTVTYKPGEHGNFEVEVIRELDYNADIPKCTRSLNGNAGYVFDTWKLTKINGEDVTGENEGTEGSQTSDGTEPATTQESETGNNEEITDTEESETEERKVTANLEYTAMWKAMPIPTITHTPTEWTNQDVTVTITAPEPGYSIEYRRDDNTDWIEYEEEFEVEQNCVIYARLAKGTNKGEEVDHEIDNIDKISPEFGEKTVNAVKEEKNDEATITVKATDNLSGIVEYGITKEGYAGPQKYTCERSIDTELTFNEIYENGTYTIYLKDAAGNTSEDTVEITNITGFNVARIVSAPEGYEDLIGTEYETLALALETSDEAAQAGNVKIEIIHNIFNEANTIQSGRDYTINLNNYYVKNQEAKTTLTVDGKLQIIDGKLQTVDENKLGTVASEFGLGIYITKNGELTLGEDDGGAPSVLSPIVKGLTYGIKKEIDENAEKVYDELTEKEYYPEGVFNFYDGKIIGGTAAFLLQRVNDTPALYDPTVITNAENKVQESTLAIVSGIEAVIGKKRYMLLEDAIDDANNVIGDSDTQVEITIVSDLAKDANHKVVVDNTKNIKLDLNGHVFTTTANDYVLENYGKLEIYDASVEDNIDITQAVAKGDYYFEQRPEGGLISNNIGVANSTAHSLLELDLTGKSGTFEVITEAVISSESGYDFGYMTVRTDEQIVEFNNTDGRKIYICGSEDKEYRFNLEGGKKYYIQFGYRKDFGGDSGSDCFIIKDMRIIGKGKITGSTNSTIFNGISSEATKNIEYEDIDLTKAVASGTYFFETRAEGGLISNNTGVQDSTAHSLLELDLTGKVGIYVLATNATISSEQNYDYGYITVRQDNKIAQYDNTNGRKVYISGNYEDKEYKFYLVGGEKYYIQFGYRKDSSRNSYSDCFIIKDMKYGKVESVGELTITSGTYECTKAGSSSEYYTIIQNESILYVNGGEIKATKDWVPGIYNGKNNNTAYTEINGGKINSYHVSVLNTGLVKINDGTLYASGASGIWNTGNLYVTGDNVNIKGYSYGITDCGKSIINAGTIYGNDYGIRNYNSNSTTIINGGIVSAGSHAIHNEYAGKIEIENVTITSAGTGIYNNSSGIIEINNIEMSSVNSSGVPTVTTGLYNNSSGKIIFNDGNIHVNGNSACNCQSGTIEINGGTLKTYNNSYATVYNYYSGIINMTGGIITGPRNGVNNQSNGKFIITGGTVESTSAYSAIYNAAYGTITIGSNDEEVSSEVPVIKSAGLYAVSNRLGTFNFYDGVLIGKENPVIHGVLNEIPEQSELVKELKEDGLQYVTLGMPTDYVAKISASENPDVSMLDESYYKLEEGYYYFVTLNSAVEACSKTNASTIELIDNPWIYRKITVDEDQDITIKFNDKTMYLHTTLNFENNGALNFINENAENVTEEERAYGNVNANGGLLIKNNENAGMNLDNISISYISADGDTNNRRTLISNYGKLDISNSKYYGSSDGNTLYAYGIYNRESGILNINNTTINYKFIQAIRNEANDTIDEEENTIYALTIRNSTISDDGRNYAFIQNSAGTTLIENSNIYSYNTNENQSTGNIIIRNSTINSYYTSIKNTSSGYIEIDNSTIQKGITNQSSGKVLIKGVDSNVSGVTNSNKAGTVEIQDGTISNTDNNAISNYGTLIITGGKIVGRNYSNYCGIYNYAGATATISGINTEVSGAKGIYNAGEVIIKSGKIIGKSSSYQGIENKGKLTLGDKDGIIKHNIIVKGAKDGIYNTGTLNFYDGIIEGNETSSIRGVIPSETEKDCIRVIYKGAYTFDNGTENGYSIISGREISVLEQVNVAYVVSKDKNYTSLGKALADTADTDTIKIIHDVSINGTIPSLNIPEGKDITLDLNSYNIVAANNNTIVNNGTLKIIDSTSHTNESGNVIEGTFVNGANTILENNGTAIIENGKYELTMDGNSNTYYDIFTNTGTLTINNGSFITNGTYSRIIYNSSGNVVINNGKLNPKSTYSRAIYNDTGIVDIENGNIVANNSYSYAFRNGGTGTINMKTGTVTGAILNSGNGDININNGTITGSITNSEGGTISFSSGTISGSVSNSKAGTINISGGTIRYSSTGTVVNNNSSGVINITGGSISGGTTAVGNSSSGTINIDGTSLSEENAIKLVANYSSYSKYGVYNSSSGIINIIGFVDISATAGTAFGIYNEYTGTINIGDSENITNNVKVSSSNYGLYINQRNHGIINYYGGTITAPTAVYGYIDNVPEEYDIIKSIDSSNNEIYEIGRTQDIVSVGETTYDTLEEAISRNESGTITLLKDIVYTTPEMQTIADSKSFILNLNGHSIKLHNRGVFITNYGTLKITDSTDEQSGMIYGFAKTIIQNEGNFEMAGGKITIHHIKYSKIVYNTTGGNVTVTGGTLYSYTGGSSDYGSDNSHIIYSDNNNDINVTGGTFALHIAHYYGDTYGGYAIYTNAENACVNISGGTFKHEYSGRSYMVYMADKGTVNISGNTESNCRYGIFMNKSGTVNIDDEANLNNSTYSIYMNGAGGYVNVNGGTTKNIRGTGSTTATLIGGNVIGTVSNCGTVDVYEGVNLNVSGDAISSCTNANIHEGATVTSTSNAISSCTNVNIDNATIIGNVYNPTSKLNMIGGSITGKDYGVQLYSSASVVTITGGTVSATAGPGILISSGTLVLGEDDGGYPSTEIPAVTGSTYGVKNDGGKFNFYDGILTGKTHATSGTVTKTPEMFKVLYSADGTVGVLGIEATFEQVATVNGIYHNDLSSAINAAIEVNGEVELCKDITTTQSIAIPAGSTVTVNLCGFSITGYTESGVSFTNNGTLIIKDSTNEGTNVSTIRNYTGKAIVNNGTLTIGTDDDTVYTNAPNIIGKTIAIENNGDFYFLDGQIGISEEEGEVIINTGTGYKPEGYSIVKQEGTNVYTLVQNQTE